MPSAKGGKVSANKALEDLSAANTGLSQVSPTMWFSANVKIQARLMEERKLDGDGIYGYLAHMLKVSNFCAHNTWSSVLSYDRAFRINQALRKCSWGEDFPWMSGAYLVRKMSDKFAGNSVHGNKPGCGKQAQPGRGRGWNKDEQGPPGEGDSQKNGKCQLYNHNKCFCCDGPHAVLDCPKPIPQVPDAQKTFKWLQTPHTQSC